MWEWEKKAIAAWNSNLAAIILCLVGTIAAIWAGLSVPSPGISIGLLAAAAAIMSIRPKMRPVEKIVWVVVLVILTPTEIRSILKNDLQNLNDRKAQNDTFSSIRRSQQAELDATVKGLTDAYNLSQQQFGATMKQFSQTNAKQQSQFNALVKKDEELSKHEEQLAESLSGKLVAGSLPTPANGCSDARVPPNALMVLLPNGNTAFSNHFPHTVFKVNGETLLKLIELSPGVVAPVMDVRGRDGKIIARFDESGFLIGSRLAVKRPDPSTLSVLDEYGEEAINIHFLNPHAIAISGYFAYQGKEVPISLPPWMTNFCSGNSGTDFDLNFK
jgi:hypothetical protein